MLKEQPVHPGIDLHFCLPFAKGPKIGLFETLLKLLVRSIQCLPAVHLKSPKLMTAWARLWSFPLDNVKHTRTVCGADGSPGYQAGPW